MVSTIKDSGHQSGHTSVRVYRWHSGLRVNSTGRRTYTREFKREVVRKCRKPGVSVSAFALAHRLNANLVRRWLRQQSLAAPASKLVRPPILLPVTVSATPVKEAKNAVAAPAMRQPPSEGRIDIELTGARIRLLGAVDADTLRWVLTLLRQP